MTDDFTRDLPQDIQAEQSTLGAMLLSETACSEVLDTLTEADFYKPAHATIFTAIEKLYTAGDPVDAVTVGAELMKYGDLNRVGGAVALHTLINSVPMPASGSYYAEIVREQATLRRLVEAGTRIVQMGYGTDGADVGQILVKAVEELEAVHATAAFSAKADTAGQFAAIDWDEAYSADFSQVDYLPGRFMERGQQVALVGDGKCGKSLMVLTWIAYAAAERPFLGDTDMRPLRVCYFDRENSLRDIVTRLQALGIAADQVKPYISYYQFPKFSGALNSSEAAVREFFGLVDRDQPDLVVLDTVSRFIDGKENDSDTWLALYRHIHAELKRRGIACVRLDHFGKDAERGARGNSAKSQDVDHVWELVANKPRTIIDAATGLHTVEVELTMRRTHTRTGIGKDEFRATRRGQKYEYGSWLPGQTALTDTPNAPARPQLATTEPGDRVAEAMAAISALLETSTEPLSGTDIIERKVMGFSKPDKREALACLVQDGYARETPRRGRGGGYQYQSIQPYHETPPNPAGTPPNPAPGGVTP